MYGKDLLPLIKASGKTDRFSQNLLKWVQKYQNKRLIVAIATEGKRQFDQTLTQSSYLYIGYTPIEDGYLMGSRLSEILCEGAKTSTWAFNGLKFVEVSNWFQQYIEKGKCCIDPEHTLYGDKERWNISEDGKTRSCIWCNNYTQHEHVELIEHKSWINHI